MIGLTRNFVMAGSILAALAAGPAWAQDNFDAGKTPAQLYAADCAICHKTPHGLGKNGSESFLREHYTASREAARAIASYLRANGGGTLPSAKRAHPAKRAGDEKTKDGKPGVKKRDAHKPTESKSTAKTGKGKTGKENAGEAMRDEPKRGKPKSSEPKAKEAEDGKPKSNDAGKSSEPKAHAPKASEAKAKQADASKPKSGKPTTNGAKPTASKKPAPKDVKPD
jgi:hypothetical protein